MARAKPTPKKEAFLIQSLTLTPTDREILQSLSQEASDNLGWTVSGSAVVRALLRQAAQQGSAWRSTQVLPFIEQEIESGTVWGKKK